MSAIGKRRIVLVKAVADVWNEFQSIQKRNMIARTFRKLGMTLPIDGSCNHELSVKDISKEHLNIGDWQREAPEDNPNDEVDPACDNHPAIEFVDADAPDNFSDPAPAPSPAQCISYNCFKLRLIKDSAKAKTPPQR
ncbi:hypothetical protein FN846DRAFT_912975 [Sphaerosporella brunnea]|uniref:Uncharacterized protein n=1 Tax=Sphaerosporella brunnea TaxID=1250544 RepID=A0A5J5EH00_9PEZI|nr:hypothetical protein FN846DRAFT_912975 [Sphaerosporella brunnea]